MAKHYCHHRNIKGKIKVLQKDSKLSAKQISQLQDIYDSAVQGKLDDNSTADIDKMIDTITGAAKKSKLHVSKAKHGHKPKQSEQRRSQKGKEKVDGMFNFSPLFIYYYKLSFTK